MGRRVVTSTAEHEQKSGQPSKGLFGAVKSLFAPPADAQERYYGRLRGYAVPGGGAAH